MYILNWYITRQFLSIFLTAVLVVTFLISGQYALKLMEYISEGASAKDALEYCYLIIPQALAFSIPWASLVAIMLVFGRLSADNEIVSMRACGISILQIISPLIIIMFILTCFCLYLQLEVSQPNLGKARDLVRSGANKNPLVALQPGIPLNLRNMKVFVDRKDEDGTIHDIQIFIPDTETGSPAQDILAPKGKVIVDGDNIIFHVERAMTETSDNSGKRQYGYSDSLDIPIYNFNMQYNKRSVTPDDKYLNTFGLFARFANLQNTGKGKDVDFSNLKLQLNERIALALGPIAFLLLGLPLAIQSNRRETSIGLFLSVILGALYYAGTLLPDRLDEHPEFYPEYLVWIMPALFQGFGIYYLLKVARK